MTNNGVDFESAIAAVHELNELATSEYLRGQVELIAMLYLPDIPLGVSRPMVRAAISDGVW